MMSSFPHHHRSANEQTIQELQEEVRNWEQAFQEYTIEIRFLKKFLTADVFENEIPHLYERLMDFYDQLDELKHAKISLHGELHNHKNDLNGMRECEDISCESFYYTRHQELGERIRILFKKIGELKMGLFSFSTPLLRVKS